MLVYTCIINFETNICISYLTPFALFSDNTKLMGGKHRNKLQKEVQINLIIMLSMGPAMETDCIISETML